MYLNFDKIFSFLLYPSFTISQAQHFRKSGCSSQVDGVTGGGHDGVVVEGALGRALAGGEDEVELLRGQVEALLARGGVGHGEGVLQFKGRGHRAGAEDGAGLETLALIGKKDKERI